MREHHIASLLSNKAFAELTDSEIAFAESHAIGCSDCQRQYDAARISAALVQARADETSEVGPFFVTRVMATLKERELSPEEAVLVRMWKTAGALVSSMAALLVVLVGLTLFSTESQAQLPSMAAGQNIYSPESVVLHGADDDELVYDQVIATMYDLEDPDE